MSDQTDPQSAAGGQQAQLRLDRLYLKDASFESPGSPALFSETEQPDVQLDLNSRTTVQGQDLYEVVLTGTVKARLSGERTAFLVEVQQAGLFHITGLEGERLKQVIGTFCLNTLFPYLRETVDALVVRGGFPALTLAPVNFDALYAQARAQQAQGGTGDGSGGPAPAAPSTDDKPVH